MFHAIKPVIWPIYRLYLKLLYSDLIISKDGKVSCKCVDPIISNFCTNEISHTNDNTLYKGCAMFYPLREACLKVKDFNTFFK